MLNIVEQLTEFPLRYLQSLGFSGGINGKVPHLPKQET